MALERPEAGIKIFRKSKMGYASGNSSKHQSPTKSSCTLNQGTAAEAEAAEAEAKAEKEAEAEELAIELRAKNVAVSSEYIVLHASPLQLVCKTEQRGSSESQTSATYSE